MKPSIIYFCDRLTAYEVVVALPVVVRYVVEVRVVKTDVSLCLLGEVLDGPCNLVDLERRETE